MYDVLRDAYLDSPGKIDSRAPEEREKPQTGAPGWLSVWVQSYLCACGVRDPATMRFVVSAITAAPPKDPRILIIQIHSALAHRGVVVAAPSSSPPPELPGTMPRQELAPVWSAQGERPEKSSPLHDVAVACGTVFALLMAIFDNGQ